MEQNKYFTLEGVYLYSEDRGKEKLGRPVPKIGEIMIVHRKVKVGSRMVGEGEACFVIFECGATFRDVSEAKKLVEAVADSGADAIKFQLVDADRLMGEHSPMVEYQTANGKKKSKVYDILKSRSLPHEEWKEIFAHCKARNLEFFATACFPEEVDFLAEIGSSAIKINAGDVNHYFLIDYVARTGLPVILDGRAKYDELETGVKLCEGVGNKNILIMHCPSGYPARNDGVNLRVIHALRQVYGYPIGFSDHSRESLMNFGALAMGAHMIEKTLTLDKNTDGVEHFMSLEPSEAKGFVQELRALEEAFGTARIMFSTTVNEGARRSIVAKRALKAGDLISETDIDFRRPGDRGISAAEFELVIGKSVKSDVAADTFLSFEMIS